MFAKNTAWLQYMKVPGSQSQFCHMKTLVEQQRSASADSGSADTPVATTCPSPHYKVKRSEWRAHMRYFPGFPQKCWKQDSANNP